MSFRAISHLFCCKYFQETKSSLTTLSLKYTTCLALFCYTATSRRRKRFQPIIPIRLRFKSSQLENQEEFSSWFLSPYSDTEPTFLCALNKRSNGVTASAALKQNVKAGGMCRYLGDGSGGHLDTLLKQQTQYAVLLLQVKHSGAEFHTFLL